ncbi:hypothetical protein EDD16DRAFT_1898954, partial [Pisolithus croceorrhizus]
FTERTPGCFVEERTRIRRVALLDGSDSTVSSDVTASTSDTPTTTNVTTSSPSSQSHYSDRSWACRQAAEAQNHIFEAIRSSSRHNFIPRRTCLFTTRWQRWCWRWPDYILNGYWSSVAIGGGAAEG